MQRNAVAWAALTLSAAAFAGSRTFTPPAPAAQEIPAEGQKAAKALSEAFEAVAEFAKPSVVQISVKKKLGPSGGRAGANPPRNQGQDQGGSGLPDMLRDMLKKAHPELTDEQLDGFLGNRDGNAPKPSKPKSGPPVEDMQFGFEQLGTGSGFVYDDKGHILTNSHVVSDADSILVTFHDGEQLEAKIVGTDPDADVAVIKVDNTSFRPLPKGNSSTMKVGAWVIAVGSPFGLEQTVTAGIVSATERAAGINKYEAFIQTDAAINPGNSGGPLLNMSGRVIGVNSAIATASRSNAGVGFAIPIDMASSLADKLIKDGKISRGMIGVALEPLTPATLRKYKLDPKTKGVRASRVVPGTPAAKAGIKAGDVLTKFDGNPVANGPALINLVSASDLGKSYPVTLLRDGKEEVVSLTPAPESEVETAFATAGVQRNPRFSSRPEAPRPEPKPTARAAFGLGIQALSPELAKQYGYPEGSKGVVVARVQADSPAEAAGLEEGDLIVGLTKDGKPSLVASPVEFREVVKDLGNEMTLLVKDVNNPDKEALPVVLKRAEGK